jgi:hypothetical protein
MDNDSKRGSGTIYGKYGLTVMWTFLVVGLGLLFSGSVVLYWVYRLSPKYGVVLSHNFSLHSQYSGLCLSWIFNLMAGKSLISSGLVLIIESCVVMLIRRNKALIQKAVGNIVLVSMYLLLVIVGFNLLSNFYLVSFLIRNK